jgi:hypothetical protein
MSEQQKVFVLTNMEGHVYGVWSEKRRKVAEEHWRALHYAEHILHARYATQDSSPQQAPVWEQILEDTWEYRLHNQPDTRLLRLHLEVVDGNVSRI